MVSVKEAQQAIINHSPVGKIIALPLSKSFGFVLSRDISAPLDLPPFPQSAMDGYAFRFRDYAAGEKLKIVGESAAGKNFTKKIKQGEAVRIFTGALVPPGADTVVMQEKMERVNDLLTIKDEKLTLGANIRPKASQIKKGESALKKGAVITAGVAGFLASLGIGKVKVFSKPRVAIIVTGSELQEPGSKLKQGNIFESNSAALCCALQHASVEPIKVFKVNDNEHSIHSAFRIAMAKADIVLFTGGISVGDYDFVGSVLKKERVSNIFYKVKQKPGKPLFFGKKSNHLVFGLPGNPAAVLSCFYEYVLPALRRFMGYEQPFLSAIQVALSKPIYKKPGLTHFLKGFTDYKTVVPLEGQESYIMRSFAHANCLIRFPEEMEKVNTGEPVEVHLLDGSI